MTQQLKGVTGDAGVNTARLVAAPTLTYDETLSSIDIATDSEWDESEHNPLDHKWLSTQFVTSLGHKVLVCADGTPEVTRRRLETHCKANGVTLIYASMSDSTRLLDLVLDALELPNTIKRVFLIIYFSAKDCEYVLSWDYFHQQIRDGVIQQKRCISHQQPLKWQHNTRTYDLHIKDLAGWGPFGLAKLAKSVGVEMASKGDMDDYKTHMFDGLIAEPEKFIDYGIGDSACLLDINANFLELVQWVQHILSLDGDDIFTRSDIPQTVGSLVATTFHKFIYSQAQNRDVLAFALRKLGILDTSSSQYRFNLACHIHSTKTYRDVSSLAGAIASIEASASSGDVDAKLKQFLKGAQYEFTGISQASVGYFAKQTGDTSAFLSLVQGGRCNNERPFKLAVDYGADIDLQGAYGGVLRRFEYPIGLPTVWAYTPNQTRPTLKQFLNRNGRKLKDNLFTITVSGLLPGCQDLIYSKIVSQYQINQAALGEWDKESDDYSRDNDLAHIPGEFVLLRKQIENGILTSEIITLLKAVCNNAEWSSILGLTVVSAAAYLESDRVESLDEWLEIVVSDRGALFNKDGKHGNGRDTRTRKWYALPLESFIGKLVDTRTELKTHSKGTLTPLEKTQADARQNTLKLFINAFYGVLASPYFPIGNTVIANNITAMARMGTWMVNKAMHTRQSITDGGIYGLNEVPFISENARRVPSLSSMNDNGSWELVKEGRLIGSLGGVDWTERLSNLAQTLPHLPSEQQESILNGLGRELDTLATEHIKGFWARYGLVFPFAVEHKGTNTFTRAAYTAKAHYALKTLTGKVVYKIRGSKLHKDKTLRVHPSYTLLDEVLNNGDRFPSNLDYDHVSLMKIAKFLLLQMSANTTSEDRQLRPGDARVEKRTARYNNSHFPILTVADYKRVTRRTNRGEYPLLFERYGESGINAVLTRMANDRL